MTPAQAAIEVIGVGAGAIGVAFAVDAAPPEAQGWTVLGLLAVIVLGIGRSMVQSIKESGDKTAAAMDRNTEAQGKVTTALALLVQESETAREEGRAKRAEILAKLDQIKNESRKHA